MDKSEREGFVRAVYEVVGKIPSGRATSYGAIAKAIGYPRFSRLVGKVLQENGETEKVIPVHRVVNSKGFLSGKESFGNENQMAYLLEEEGVTVENDSIRDWKTIFWDPLQEIEI